MRKRQFQHHVDSLPDNALTVSGGGPAPFDKEAGAFSGSWDWGIIVIRSVRGKRRSAV